MTDLNITPAEIGLPQYPEFRDVQLEALEQTLYGKKRFQVIALPTGGGKSLVVASTARILDAKTIVLTANRGLQDSYEHQFGAASNPVEYALSKLDQKFKRDPFTSVDIRGRANYTCPEFRDTNCEDGLHCGCRHATGTRCTYGKQLSIAKSSRFVVTNYSYWLHSALRGKDGLSGADLLVLDEAHEAPEELAKFLHISIREKDLRDIMGISKPDMGESIEGWAQFAGKELAGLREEIKSTRKRIPGLKYGEQEKQIRRLRAMQKLEERLGDIRSLGSDLNNWLCEEKAGTKYGRVWEFDPIWPGKYAECLLFRHIPRVILMSATMRKKTTSLLGIKGHTMEYRDWPRIFPENRCPVYHLPTVRMNYHMPSEDLDKWVARIDEIIESRLDRKGIIHTVSYNRQEYLLRNSRNAHLFHCNTNDPMSPTAAEIVEKFRKAKPPAVLVSPSFSTGWDFPYSDCEYQIIGKIPLPPLQSKIMKARQARDSQYPGYLAMLELVQACGRGMRAADDRCETFIIDNSIGWFLAQNSSLKPSWFSVRKILSLPKPPKSL